MSTAQPTREIPWADTAATGHVVEPADVSKGTGWTGTTRPPFQWFNWILRQAARWIQYLRARGIPDYDSAESYTVGDRVQHTDGKSYVCIQANGPASPKTPGYSNTDYWTVWGYTLEQLAGAFINHGDASTGYVNLLGGLSVHWEALTSGSGALPTTPGSVSHTFDTAFANACVGAWFVPATLSVNHEIGMPSLLITPTSKTACSIALVDQGASADGYIATGTLFSVGY